jgi:hypothetical protein
VLFAAERPLSGGWVRASNVSKWPTGADRSHASSAIPPQSAQYRTRIEGDSPTPRTLSSDQKPAPPNSVIIHTISTLDKQSHSGRAAPTADSSHRCHRAKDRSRPRLVEWTHSISLDPLQTFHLPRTGPSPFSQVIALARLREVGSRRNNGSHTIGYLAKQPTLGAQRRTRIEGSSTTPKILSSG